MSTFTTSASPAGATPSVSFQIRADKPARQVCIRIHGRDNETLVPMPADVNGAWRFYSFDSAQDIRQKWGEHSNGQVDWPFRSFCFEVLDRGGDSTGPSEQICLDDQKLFRPEP